MQMNETEILGSYRRAENKKEQIQILADLNCCDNETIIELLKKNGVPEEEFSSKRGRKTKKAEIKVSVPTKQDIPTEDDMTLHFPDDVKDGKSMYEYSITNDPQYPYGYGPDEEKEDLEEGSDSACDKKFSIPDAVINACMEKAGSLESKIIELEKERCEILSYLHKVLQND